TQVSDEREARRAFVEQGFVDCIVQLPEKLFIGTGIPACLWLLSKNRDGRGEFRKRRGEILFIDAGKRGTMVTRRQRVLSDDDIDQIAGAYHHFRDVEGERVNIAGFTKTATIGEVRANDYKLTPGIYVGTETQEQDDKPFEERMSELTV